MEGRIVSEQVDQPIPEDEDATWRLNLPEVFRPIALRYGKHKFSVAWNAGSVQESLMLISSKLHKIHELQPAVMMAASAANQLAMYAAESQGMTYSDIREIQMDIERAAALHGASRVGQGGKLIIPS